MLIGIQDRSRAALKAASIHLLVSLAVALLTASVVFFLWYPYPYREIAGGRELFFWVVTVDVVCGPLLTAVIFNPKKSRRELSLDLGLVGVIQLVALFYGLNTVAIARPVYLVYEVDRFQVVTAADILEGQLKPEKGGLHRLPWSGPRVIGVREPKDSDERLHSLELSLQGIEPSARPDWWQDYALSRQRVLKRAQPLSSLRSKRPQELAIIDHAVRAIGAEEESLAWLPMTSSKSTAWVVLVDKRTTEVRGFAPVDGF